MKVLDGDAVLRRDASSGLCLEALLGQTLQRPNIVRTMAWAVITGEVRVGCRLVADLGCFCCCCFQHFRPPCIADCCGKCCGVLVSRSWQCTNWMRASSNSCHVPALRTLLLLLLLLLLCLCRLGAAAAC